MIFCALIVLCVQSKTQKRKEKIENYIDKNRKQALELKPKDNNDKNTHFMNQETYGKVPQYIIDRRMEDAEKEKQRLIDIEKSKIPKGMRQMPENERLETLEILENKKKAVIKNISQLPLTIETPSMIEKEKTLREKLQELEQAIQLFQKKIVYVAQ